jgi:hypothetical protein
MNTFETGLEMDIITFYASTLQSPLPDIHTKETQPQLQSNYGRHMVEVGCLLSFELITETLLGSRDANHTY